MSSNLPISEQFRIVAKIRERAMSVLAYEPDTGLFRWKVRVGQRGQPGAIAGSKDTHGYWHVTLDGKVYLAHRLAWLFAHGEFPAGALDHINGDRLDNRLDNLRPATRAQNSANSRPRSDNKSGHRGVHWHRQHQKWCASICVEKRRITLGLFRTKEEAAAAYQRAAEVHQGDFRRSA